MFFLRLPAQLMKLSNDVLSVGICGGRSYDFGRGVLGREEFAVASFGIRRFLVRD